MEYVIGTVALDKVSGKLVHMLSTVHGNRPPEPNSEDIRDIVWTLNQYSPKDTMFVDIAFVLEGEKVVWEDKDEVIAPNYHATQEDIEDYLSRIGA